MKHWLPAVVRFLRACLGLLSALLASVLAALHLRRVVPDGGMLADADDGVLLPSQPPQTGAVPSVAALKVAACLAVRKTLVLDLDETLVHATEEWALTYDFTVSLHLRTSEGTSPFSSLLSRQFSVLMFCVMLSPCVTQQQSLWCFTSRRDRTCSTS